MMFSEINEFCFVATKKLLSYLGRGFSRKQVWSLNNMNLYRNSLFCNLPAHFRTRGQTKWFVNILNSKCVFE